MRGATDAKHKTPLPHTTRLKTSQRLHRRLAEAHSRLRLPFMPMILTGSAAPASFTCFPPLFISLPRGLIDARSCVACQWTR